MDELPIKGALRAEVLERLEASSLFEALDGPKLDQVANRARLFQYAEAEAITVEGETAEHFFVILSGEAKVAMNGADGGEIWVGTIGAYESVGEMGLILDEPRTATVTATKRTLALRFDAEAFDKLYDRVPGFGPAITRALARRLERCARRLPLRQHDAPPPVELMDALPIELIQRHRVLPMSRTDDVLTVGFVDDPRAEVLAAIRREHPGVDVESVRIDHALFDRALKSRAGRPDTEVFTRPGRPDADTRPLERPDGATVELVRPGASPRLDDILRRMVAEGASDVHLSAGERPRWRIDGEIYGIEDTKALAAEEVLNLLDPVMSRRSRAEFAEDSDTDFAYALAGIARFRVNLFRDAHGIGAVLRQIPMKIMTMDELQLPSIIQKLCDQPKGLVLVTGPTGSGKSTTLAAMIDHINHTRRAHIITLEDPIEFMHKSDLALVNQREVGSHTKSFARALRAALREDPDIVLVGEMRDLETIALALETAQTGHLVFATLHTSTAASTVDRIIDMFGAGQQNQVRSTLSEVLRGVIAQSLCRRNGGGRVAAFEIMVGSPAVSNLIREAKTHQLINAMQTGRSQGNATLNEALAELVFSEKIPAEEALAKAVDKADLIKRLGVDYPLL